MASVTIVARRAPHYALDGGARSVFIPDSSYDARPLTLQFVITCDWRAADAWNACILERVLRHVLAKRYKLVRNCTGGPQSYHGPPQSCTATPDAGSRTCVHTHYQIEAGQSRALETAQRAAWRALRAVPLHVRESELDSRIRDILRCEQEALSDQCNAMLATVQTTINDTVADVSALIVSEGCLSKHWRRIGLPAATASA